MENKFIGKVVNDYVIEDYINEGQIGKVFKAHRQDIDEYRAVKFIPINNLRSGWENEITKVVKIKNVRGVVRYYDHGYIEVEGDKYLYMTWDYISSQSLRDVINDDEITLPILVDIFETILQIFHACGQQRIVHADLHSGNILVESNNELLLNPEQRRVYITDFGYATADGLIDILDDFKGLDRIIKECLVKIDFHKLEGKDKSIYRLFKNEIPKILLETNITEGDWVRNPKKILEKWVALRDSNTNHVNISTNIGDYLAAEHIGKNYEEWEKLFVPEILAVDELFSKNICVLTGLRGCGKTMIFRRMTAIFDEHLGKAGVIGADNFIGFYLNARNIAEAFPWLPDRHEDNARLQVINFFHLSWCLEIIEWLKIKSRKDNLDLNWITEYFRKYYPNNIYTSNSNYNILFHLSSFFSLELDRSRLKSSYNQNNNWELTDLTFLEEFAVKLIEHCNLDPKLLFFFLDDYSTPLVSVATQRILNPIIFRRSASVFFKVATESTESFEPYGLNGKVLEEEDDYKLIDFGTYAFSLKKPKRHEILSSIIKKRIERHPKLANRNIELKDILGQTKLDNVQLSQLIRNDNVVDATGMQPKKVSYVGIDVFCYMWSSDIRESISLFAEMISKVNLDQTDLDKDYIISPEIQDNAYRDAGGKFLSLLESVTNPSKNNFEISYCEKTYGGHLVEIAKAFHEVATYELLNKNSKNVNQNPPKQARRIEITGVDSNMPDEIYDYYRGILRYGLFIRDFRGKSVRGKAVPRLYLRGLLIPYFRLSFSRRDSITMNWDEFCMFLRDPKVFKKEFILKQKQKNDTSNEQYKMDL